MIHVCFVIHENPSKTDSKATGWLGTQILKKAETIFTVTKDITEKRIAHVSGTETRGEDFDDFSFRINETGIPEIISNENIFPDIQDNPFV